MRVGARHRVRLPASLALVGKALAQVQLAAAELDPELDPLLACRRLRGRSVLAELAGWADPQAFWRGPEAAAARVPGDRLSG